MTIKLPRLCVADQFDGSTATATILGSTGATNLVYTTTFGVAVADYDWTLSATISGNSSGTITLSAGSYLAYVKATLGAEVACSPPVAFEITDGSDVSDIPHYEACQGIQQAVQGLGLPNLASDRVVIQKLPYRAVKAIGDSGVIITPVTGSRQPRDQARDLVTYRVQITYFRASNQHLDRNIREDLKWKEAVENYLSEAPPAGLSSFHRVEILPGPVVIPAAFESHYDVGATVAACHAYRTRAND